MSGSIAMPAGAPTPAVRTVVDVRQVVCPLTWVRTKIALDQVSEGDAVEVLLLPGEPLENVPRTAEEEGHRVLAREHCPGPGEGAWRVLIVKGTPRHGELLP